MLRVSTLNPNSLFRLSNLKPIPHHSRLSSLSKSLVEYTQIWVRGLEPKTWATASTKASSEGFREDFLLIWVYFSFSPTQGRNGKPIFDSTFTHLPLNTTLFGGESNIWTLFFQGLKERLLLVICKEEKTILSMLVENSKPNLRHKQIKAIIVRTTLGWIWPNWTQA